MRFNMVFEVIHIPVHCYLASSANSSFILSTAQTKSLAVHWVCLADLPSGDCFFLQSNSPLTPMKLIKEIIERSDVKSRSLFTWDGPFTSVRILESTEQSLGVIPFLTDFNPPLMHVRALTRKIGTPFYLAYTNQTLAS